MLHPQETNPRTLQTLADTRGLHVCFSRMEIWENNYRANLTPAQLLDYRRFNGEIMDCPDCGPDREVHYEEFPDMVGTTSVTSCARCGLVLDNSNDALEYSNGKAVDVR